MTEGVRRRDATQATLDQWKGVAFRLGHADCVRLTASHMRRMGHKVRLPAKGRYATVRSAMRELSARGYADLPAAMDAMGFERIAPAAARIGDVIALPSEHAMGCLTVALGNGRVVGWHADMSGADVLQPLEYSAAWRISPR